MYPSAFTAGQRLLLRVQPSLHRVDVTVPGGRAVAQVACMLRRLRPHPRKSRCRLLSRVRAHWTGESRCFTPSLPRPVDDDESEHLLNVFENWSISTVHIPETNRLRRFNLGRPTQLPDSALDGSYWLNWGASSSYEETL